MIRNLETSHMRSRHPINRSSLGSPRWNLKQSQYSQHTLEFCNCALLRTWICWIISQLLRNGWLYSNANCVKWPLRANITSNYNNKKKLSIFRSRRSALIKAHIGNTGTLLRRQNVFAGCRVRQARSMKNDNKHPAMIHVHNLTVCVTNAASATAPMTAQIIIANTLTKNAANMKSYK